MMAMKIRYFSDTDTALLEFSENPVHETREATPDIYLDLDAEGNLVTMTIEHANQKAGMHEVSFPNMGSNG